MRTSFRIIMVIVFALLVGLPRAHSATISATSCSQSDVQAAVNSANNGDTVNIPPGSCTWSGVLTVTKGIRITGSGSPTITGTTNGIVTFNVTEGVCASTPYELDHINFINAYTTASNDDGLVNALGACKNFKIHDNTFIRSGTNSQFFILVNGDTYGVIYKNTFNQTGSGGLAGAVSLKHTTWGGDTFGDGSWKDVPNYNSDQQKFLYIEGNTFISDTRKFFSGSNAGGRVVYRYNTITNANPSGHGFDSDNGGRGRAMRIAIGYNNIISGPSDYSPCFFWRGGTGLFYDNTINGWQAGSCIQAKTYRNISEYGINANTGLSGPSGSGICWPQSGSFLVCSDGTHCTTKGAACKNGSTCTSYRGQCSDGTGCSNPGLRCPNNSICTNYSGPHYMCYNGIHSGQSCCNPSGDKNPNPNCVAAASCVGGASACIGPVDNVAGNGSGWPCRDGIGLGRDSGLGTLQASEPLFVWSNTGPNATLAVSGGSVQNTDYFIDGSNCTSGVTSGLDAAKCAACTQGVGYWATDTRKLYRCGAANTWSVYYTEYACPHPLTGLTGNCNGSIEGAGGYPLTSSVVTPPDNVRIVP